MCVGPLSAGLSLCPSVPFSPFSFHLHFSFVERNSRLLARTIARPLAYESSRGAVRWGGKKGGKGSHKTFKSVPSRLQNFNQPHASTCASVACIFLGEIFMFVNEEAHSCLLIWFDAWGFTLELCWTIMLDNLSMSVKKKKKERETCLSVQLRFFSLKCPNTHDDIVWSCACLRHKISHS